MAKMTQGKMTETPQAAKDGLATTVFGGEAPTKHDVIKSANAPGTSSPALPARPSARAQLTVVMRKTSSGAMP